MLVDKREKVQGGIPLLLQPLETEGKESFQQRKLRGVSIEEGDDPRSAIFWRQIRNYLEGARKVSWVKNY